MSYPVVIDWKKKGNQRISLALLHYGRIDMRNLGKVGLTLSRS